MNLGILMALAIFIAISLLTYGIMLIHRSRQVIKERFKQPDNPAMALLRRDENQSAFKKRLLHWLSLSGKLALRSPEETSQIRSSLIMAGYRQANAPAVYFGIRAVFALFLPLPYLLMAIVQKQTVTTSALGISFLISAVGYFIPHYLLKMSISRRQDRLDKALPDVLDLFIVCMEAGLALQAAMNRVADEIKHAYKDFHSELQITGAELRAGIPQEAALKNFSTRTGVPSINSLVTLMIQTEKLGTSIAQSLRTHADFTRVQRSLRAEEKAAKTPIKILIPMIFFIFPAMFVVVAGPAAIQVVKTIFPALKH